MRWSLDGRFPVLGDRTLKMVVSLSLLFSLCLLHKFEKQCHQKREVIITLEQFDLRKLSSQKPVFACLSGESAAAKEGTCRG